MCLMKKRLFPKISKERITVYKIVENYYGRYLTPVREVDIKLNSTLKAKDTSIWEMFCSYFIYGCGVHAYIDLETAQRIRERYYGKDYLILKCVIPPNTFYWEGEDGDIASRELEITDVSVSVSYKKCT